jgi:hypothetical protein
MIVSTRLWLVLAMAAPALLASGTAAWEMNSYPDFIRGRFDGVSLSRDGRLSLAPKLDTVFSSDQSVIWSVAQAPDGSLYAATGHRGRVYRVDRTGKSSLIWTADQPEVFAIAVDRAGVLFAGTSPVAASIASKTARPPSISLPRRATSGRCPFRATGSSTSARAIKAKFSASMRRAKANCTTKPASRTSPAWRWMRKAASWPAQSRMACSTG